MLSVKAKIERKHKDHMTIAHITVAFETNTAMNNGNKCKSSD